MSRIKINDYMIPPPFQFNPIKHHLAFIRDFIAEKEKTNAGPDTARTIKHIGTSVMDIYAGELSISGILEETEYFLKKEGINGRKEFEAWAGKNFSDFRILTLSDNSVWTLKYHDNELRYVHIFPARSSPHTFRVKANTLKSAVLYIIAVGKDYVTEDDLNRSRAMAGLSPLKEVAEAEAVFEMIEILRNH